MEECAKLVEDTIKVFGGLDVIIGNAVSTSRPFASQVSEGECSETILFSLLRIADYQF